MLKSYTRSRGFTLIEIMIVVAILGILASIAYPSYVDYVKKGKRTEGRAAVLNMLVQQEKYMNDRGKYLAVATGAPINTTREPIQPMKTWSGDSQDNPNYKLKAEACTGLDISECVMVTAIPQFTDTEAGSLTATSTQEKSCTGTAASTNKALCWP